MFMGVGPLKPFFYIFYALLSPFHGVNGGARRRTSTKRQKVTLSSKKVTQM